MPKLDTYPNKKSEPSEARQVTSTDTAVDKVNLDVFARNTSSEPLNVTGSFTVSAPGPIKVTGTSVTDTSAAFPAVDQTDRSALSVRNIDAAESIFIVNSTGITKAAAGVDIWEIGPNETINVDLDDSNKIILVAESGKTVSIQILEIKGP